MSRYENGSNSLQQGWGWSVHSWWIDRSRARQKYWCPTLHLQEYSIIHPQPQSTADEVQVWLGSKISCSLVSADVSSGSVQGPRKQFTRRFEQHATASERAAMQRTYRVLGCQGPRRTSQTDQHQYNSYPVSTGPRGPFGNADDFKRSPCATHFRYSRVITHCRSFSNFPRRSRDGFQVSSVYFVPCPWLIPECRLDRLLILLDTGSNNNVRATAAKQIAQLAVKSVRSDVPADEWDVKQHPSSSTKDTGEYAELMAVVGRVC